MFNALQILLSNEQHNKQITDIKKKSTDGKYLFKPIELKQEYLQQLIRHLQIILMVNQGEEEFLEIIQDILFIVTFKTINYTLLHQIFRNKLLRYFR